MTPIQPIEPKLTFSSLVLPPAVSAQLTEIMEDFEFQDALAKAELPVRRKIILYGPPGCGKTSIAHALAAELKMKLFVVSMAGVVDSFMGSSEKNVKKIFEAAEFHRCVVLMDEFDSIACARAADPESSASLTENRIVNTLLTSMDNTKPLGMILAATNLYDSLDPAVRRRFDSTISVPSVSREGLLEIARITLKGRFGIEPRAVLELASTPAAVVQVATDMVRRKVIAGERARRAETKPLFSAGPSTPETKKVAMQDCLNYVKKTTGPSAQRAPAKM